MMSKLLKKLLLRMVVTTIPIMILSAYVVSMLRDWLVEENIFQAPDIIYVLFIFFILWGVERMTIGLMLDELIKKETRTKQEK